MEQKESKETKEEDETKGPTAGVRERHYQTCVTSDWHCNSHSGLSPFPLARKVE